MPEPKPEEIFVQINENTPIAIQLPINKPLNEIRLILANEPNLRMDTKMNFVNPFARILRNKECEHLLSEILDSNNLKIIGEQEPEPKLEGINVQINSDTPVLIPLSMGETMNEIRLLLADDPNIRMSSKMAFMSPFSRIPQNYERNFTLTEILHPNNNLKIIGEHEPDWEYIKSSCKLEYGVNFTEKGPESAKKKAFDITKLDARKLASTDAIDETIVCQTEIDKICVQNFLVKSEITANLPRWLLISTALEGSGETENHKNSRNSITCQTSKIIKATISYSDSEIKPTKEFIESVDKALASDDPPKNLEEVAKDYGPLWCKKLGIGGRIVSKESKEKNTTECNNSREIKASVKLRVNEHVEISGDTGKSQQTKKMSLFANETSSCRIFGGSEDIYREESKKGWINSLNDFQKWAVAEYAEINSIFDILDQERRSKIATALTKRIVESQVEALSFRMDLSKTDPYIYELPSNLQLSNTDRIFVTVMKGDESQNEPEDLFATRVHYIDNKDLPVILIHRLGELKKRSVSPMIKLKLGWIVVGISPILNLFEHSSAQPVFESDEIEIKANNKRLMAVIPNKGKIDPNSSLLATCVSRAKNLQDDPKNSRYITGTHFYKNVAIETCAIEACAFCYDLQNTQAQFDDMPIKLSVNYSIVAGTGKHQFGQTQIISKPITSSLLGSLLSQPKHYKVLFDVYSELTEQPMTPATTPPNEQEPLLSAQKTLQSPVFVSLVLDNCPAHCIHGFFNITPNHAIFESLNNSITKNGQNIAYFCVMNYAPLI
ncbi:2356_t:CDS:2 [Ambispora leptoticha]|uniref:2356_t:CDS:1 n=1 Tax=Ambispora leptoticha TaxID=144679 RepID=A0A9N8WF03_9GLOM|nr:2356_t:CDS:2 [Ambispora leptoticha]